MSDERVVKLLTDLIAIDSVNPAYPGGVGEAGVADYVERWASDTGLEVERQPVSPGRDNVLVTLRAPNSSGTLLFEAHMDTVSLDSMGEAGLRPEVRDGRLHGRGACDTKGSLAAMMAALERLRERVDELNVDVALLAAVDEEHAFTGVMAYVGSDAEATAAVVGEPTDLRVVVAHKGCVRGDIVTHGRAAHSSEPERGVSAIDVMADVLVELRSIGGQLAHHHHDLLGGPTFSVGQIEGGTGVNIVPDRCTITYDRRTLPGELSDAVIGELDAVLDRVRRRRPEARIERREPRLIDGALDTSPDTALARAAGEACRSAGADPEPIGVPYGTDASKLQAIRGVPAIVLGPGSITKAHSADEYVPIDELSRAVDIYAGIALRMERGEGART